MTMITKQTATLTRDGDKYTVDASYELMLEFADSLFNPFIVEGVTLMRGTAEETWRRETIAPLAVQRFRPSDVGALPVGAGTDILTRKIHHELTPSETRKLLDGDASQPVSVCIHATVQMPTSSRSEAAVSVPAGETVEPLLTITSIPADYGQLVMIDPKVESALLTISPQAVAAAKK